MGSRSVGRFFDIGALVSRKSFIVGEEDISIGVEVVLDMKEYKSWSWFIKLARVLLVLYSKAY